MKKTILLLATICVNIMIVVAQNTTTKKIYFDKNNCQTNDYNSAHSYCILNIDDNNNVYGISTRYKLDGKKIWDGPIKKFHSSVNKPFTEVFEFGIGKAKDYRDNGQVLCEWNIVNGDCNFASFFYDTGELLCEGKVFNGMLDGEIKYYDKMGNHVRTIIHRDNGKEVKKRHEKWMLLAHSKQPTFFFEDYVDSIVVINTTSNKKITLLTNDKVKYVGVERTFGDRNSNYSLFFDEYFPQERGIRYLLTYVSPYKIKFHCQMNWKNLLGYAESKYDFVMIKDLKEENDRSEKDLSELGVVYRTDFKYGKIGEDYVPAITSTYNAGKKYLVNGVEMIQEVDYRTRVEDGDYVKDIKGYTAVYQLINTSNKTLLLSFSINGTSKMTDIVKNTRWFSYNAFDTDVTYTDFNYKNHIILGPNESFKDQLIAGVEIPINYALLVDDIVEVTPGWLNNLKAAVSGSDYNYARSFLNDPIASKYYKEQIEKNINQLQEQSIKNYTELNKKNITITIYPKNEVLFDPDFESDVVISILNNGLDKVKVHFETPFGKFEEVLVAKQRKEVSRKIKGVSKANLKATIVSIEKL